MKISEQKLEKIYGRSSKLRGVAVGLICVILSFSALPIMTLELIVNLSTGRKETSSLFYWSQITILLLDKVCGIKIKILGLKNLQKSSVIMSNHESTLEAGIFAAGVMQPVASIVKRSLYWTPPWNIFYIYKKAIGIDRNDSSVKAFKGMISKAEKVLDQGQSLLIFPEGTRVNLGETKEYKSGLFMLSKKYDIVPTAVSTASIFGKTFMHPKRKGVIYISFLEPIKANPKNSAKIICQETEAKIRAEYQRLQKLQEINQ